MPHDKRINKLEARDKTSAIAATWCQGPGIKQAPHDKRMNNQARGHILNYHIKNVYHATYGNADNADNVKSHVCMNMLIRYKKN